MTLERFIHHAAAELPDPAETVAEARERLRDRFPRTSLRRMTHLGLLVGAAMERAAPDSADAVVYASTFAETRALEDYLNSFPAASPLLFQTSIHPSGVQQALIARQQPVARLWPMAARERLVEQALLTALMEPAARVIVTGGEERGTWMLERGMASDRTFAFALELTRDAADAAGRVTFMADGRAEAAGPSLASLTECIAARRPLAWAGAGGAWTLEWR